jgi:tetratricopeptide (TPR) repeat protein
MSDSPLAIRLAQARQHHRAGRLADAEALYREAVQLHPDAAAAHVGLGLALRDQARGSEAEICFRDALRLDPQCAEAHTALGLLHQFQGRAGDARAALIAALHSDPNNIWALSGLSRLTAVDGYTFTDEDLKRMEALARQSALPPKERSTVHFALARVYEHQRAYDEAFGHYSQANQLLSETLPPYDPAQHSQFVDRLIAVLAPAFFERALGVHSELPIFVVGMPRSGTTLAEQILASHPRVRGLGELHDIGQIATVFVKRLGGPASYPESLTRLDAALARPFAEEYLRRLQQGGDATRVVDKMPLNYQHLGIIALLFPDARIVHCRRDPVDTCLSCYFQEFARPLPFGRNLEHLGRHYRDYQRLMAHQSRVLPLPIFELDYEELTANQEAVSRRLVAFCGLDWDERCLRFHETERTVNTATALQVRRPLYRSAVGRWKHYQAHLGPLLKNLGTD